MKKSIILVAGFVGALIAPARAAVPLTSATIAEVKNNVSYQTNGVSARPAKLGDVVKDTDIVRTGERSLAELEFNDKTITRIGSQSIFSFNFANREFKVQRGLAVICVPKGAGGGRVVAPAITAAIQGTTVVVWDDAIIFLEGTGIITTLDGKQSKPIHGGQIARLIKGVLTISDVWLDPLMKSRLLTGRTEQLPTWAQIQEVASGQEDALKRGNLIPVPSGTPPPEPPDIRDPSYREEGLRGLHEKGRWQPPHGGYDPPPYEGNNPPH